MALQLDYSNSETGASKTGAYWRIVYVTPFNGSSIYVKVRVYGSESLCNHGSGKLIEEFEYTEAKEIDGELNPIYSTLLLNSGIPAIYAYLKTRPEYAGAIDV